ncbi:hypothetical protein GCM10010129_39440 [Streptomyces fumigatiscleroticus]|nr:hypothetical protein GCM10010129_39440 [Streptomyces fumigatiscleroticus]
MTTTSSLVLRGDGAVLRLEAQTVVVRRAHEEVRIPLEAIEDVLPDGRMVGVRLTAPDGADAAVYRVENVSEAAVTAFAEAVRGLLPPRPAGAPRADGSALVTVRSLDGPVRRRFGGTRAALTAVAVLIVALDVAVGIAGGPQFSVALLGTLVPATSGGLMVGLLGRGLYRMWRLPRHGITVMAEFSHYTNKSRVYRYWDASGTAYTHTATGGDRVELSYDPRDPRRAVVCEGPVMRVVMGVIALIGAGLAGGGLFGMGVLVVRAFTGQDLP